MSNEYGISPALAAIRALAGKTEAPSRADLEEVMSLIEIEEEADVSYSLPYWNCRVEGDPKTIGEHAREALRKWAKERAV